MEKHAENLVWTKRFITAAIIQGAIIVGFSFHNTGGDFDNKTKDIPALFT